MISADDIADFWKAFRVQDAMAIRNAFAFPLTASEARQFAAGRAVVKDDNNHDTCYLPWLASLAMGDLNAA